jgi:methylenetetrahydrofolate reductase (NADPH)
VRHAKEKVDAGGEYIVTQMFFDNRHYFDYVEKCRAAGIEVPIIPGIKVLTSSRQISGLPRTFYCEIPAALADEVSAAGSTEVEEIGIEWATRQARELLEYGAPSIHFYVMANAMAVGRVVRGLDL